MGGIAKIFSPSKPAPIVAPPPAPTQDSAAVAAQSTQAADTTPAGRGRAANISSTSINDQLNSDSTDQFSVRKKLLGN